MAKRQLIINADDLGYDPQVTAGIVKSMREGVVSSCTLMVNTPYSEEAARAARALAVGLHLNLARHAPADASFPGELLVDGAFSEPRARELPADAVERETIAQLDRLSELMGRPATHIDVHKHLHRNPRVLEGVLAAARRRSVPVRAVDNGMRARIRAWSVTTTDHFIGDAGEEAYWTLDRFRAALEILPTGLTELMCHPGYTPSEVRSGYAAQREVELETFLHVGARALIERLGIELCDFRALSHGSSG
jgi:chitin disaccharide deacetylase